MAQKRPSVQVRSDKASTNGHQPPPLDTVVPADAAAEVIRDTAAFPREAVVDAALSRDPLDLRHMRIDPAKLATVVGVKATHIRVGRPDDQDFFRVHDAPDYVLDTYLLFMKADREYYFVDAALWGNPLVFKELKLYRVYYFVHLSGALGLWPVPLPDADGNQNSWHQSAMVVAEQAKSGWLRLQSGSGGYLTLPGHEITEAPVWPAMDFQEVVRVAFRAKIVTDLEHPKLVQLLKGLRPTPAPRRP
jgi:hypothetical protein